MRKCADEELIMIDLLIFNAIRAVWQDEILFFQERACKREDK